MQNKIYKLLTLGLLVPCFTIEAQKEFNALDHILQKRPGIDTLASSHWYDNLFISGGVGVEGVLNGVSVVPGRSRIGMTGAVYAGKWFNSRSAVRLGIQAGIPQHQLTDVTRRYFVHGGITLDYMMNLTNYLYGYKPNRIFNLIPFAGAGAHIGAVTRNRIEPSVSVRGGLHATVRLSQGLNLFIEPAVRVYSDNYDLQTNWRRYDVVPALMAGLTYTMIPRQNRVGVSPFYNEHLFDNLFFSAGVGGGILMSGSTMNRLFYNHMGPEFSVAIGNWFTPVSGVRLSVTGNVFKQTKDYLTTFGSQLDYMMNLDALFEGYHAKRIFRIYGIAGLNVAFPEKTGKTGNAVGVGVGVQGNFRLSSTTDLFIEPRVNVFTNKFAGGFTNGRFDAPATVLFGITYRRPDNGSYKRATFENNKLEDNIFISAGIGVNAPISGYVRTLKMDAVQPMATAAIGKWFTPVSGLRINGEAGLLGEVDYKGRFARTKLIGVGLDYMLDITNFIGGHYPDRPVHLRATLGGSALFNNAAGKYSESGFQFGVVGGLQGSIRLNSAFEVYIEPRVGLYTDGLLRGSLPPFSGDLLASVTAGLIYRFKSYDAPGYRQSFDSETQGKWFFSMAGGVGTVVNSAISTWHPGPSVAMMIGKEYSPLSAWRTGIRYNQYPELPKRKGGERQIYFGIDGDYMMNLTTLTTGYDPAGIFNLYGIAGISLGVADSRNAVKFVPGAHVALNASLRLNDFLSFYLEPRLDIYGKHFMNNNNSYRDFDSSISAMAGLSWKFKL